MATSQLATSVAAQNIPGAQVRTAKVSAILAPVLAENDSVTGWQVLLELGGGLVRRATVASTYQPIPGDVVTVLMYLNTVFVIDKMTVGESGLEPGGRVAYGYIVTPGTYRSAAVGTEVELDPLLTKTISVRNGAAYEVHLYTGYANAVANQWAFFRLRQSTVGGADIGEWFRQATTTAGAVFGFEGTMLIKNETGVDFDVTIVPTLTSPAGGVASAFCTTQARAYVEIKVKGSSLLYPHAAALSAPPDLT